MFTHICSCVHCTLAEHLVCIQVCLQCCSTSFRELHTKVRVFLLLPVCVSDVHVHSVCAPQTECLVVDLPSLGPLATPQSTCRKAFCFLGILLSSSPHHEGCQRHLIHCLSALWRTRVLVISSMSPVPAIYTHLISTGCWFMLLRSLKTCCTKTVIF